MKKAAVTGYASMDYPAILEDFFKGDQTVIIRERGRDAFPRPGGSPLYTARCLAGEGFDTSVITWIGDDNLGGQFRDCVIGEGIDPDGMVVIPSGSTPVCFLLYQPDGSCGCCFDPGFMGREVLTSRQVELIKAADLVCVTVGPPDIGMQVISHARDDAGVAWVAKNDPVSYPEKLRNILGQRADYIFCNIHEREWIDAALRGRQKSPPLIVMTNGAAGVTVERGHQIDEVPVKTLEFNDACGAGDTLAGGCLAALMSNESDARSIAGRGIDAAHALLKQRT